jgi:Fe-Mn family superoxide dismutase
MMTRRNAIKTTALAAAAIAATTNAIGQGAIISPNPPVTGPFTLPPLPYAFDALEPHIDARTMEIHHDRHHKAYVDNLNKAVAAHPDVLKAKSTEEMLRDLGAGGVTFGSGMSQEMARLPVDVRAVIRNSGGGHYNHQLFWQMMKKGGGGEPKAELAKAIEQNFGSFADFKTKFTDMAMKTFGSGWAWLTLTDGILAVESTPNQDSPIAFAFKQVLLGLDVWEHAYYLKYQNKRADYIAAWWNVVNWDFVAERYSKLSK